MQRLVIVLVILLSPTGITASERIHKFEYREVSLVDQASDAVLACPTAVRTDDGSVPYAQQFTIEDDGGTTYLQFNSSKLTRITICFSAFTIASIGDDDALDRFLTKLFGKQDRMGFDAENVLGNIVWEDKSRQMCAVFQYYPDERANLIVAYGNADHFPTGPIPRPEPNLKELFEKALRDYP